MRRAIETTYVYIRTCALAITSTTHIAAFHARNVATVKVIIPVNKPAWKKANGMPRNPVPSS